MFHFSKGTIMQHDNVAIAEGALPVCAQVRAVDHERERSHALVLHEHAKLVAHPPVSPEHAVPGVPQLPADAAGTVPGLMGGGAARKAPGRRAETPSPRPAGPQAAASPARPPLPGDGPARAPAAAPAFPASRTVAAPAVPAATPTPTPTRREELSLPLPRP